MSRLYIFGLGSPYGWDRIGWAVTDRLSNTFASKTDIVVDTLSSPISLFSHPITPDDEILFIDSMIGQAPAGTVQEFGPLTLPPASPRLSTHGIDLRTTVALLTGMGSPDEHIHIIAIEAPADTGSAEYPRTTQDLTPSVTALAAAVTDWVVGWQQTPRGTSSNVRAGN